MFDLANQNDTMQSFPFHYFRNIFCELTIYLFEIPYFILV